MPVAETSRWAYATVPLEPRQQAIAAMLAEHGELSDQELAGKLGWPINCVTPRRGELVELGLVLPARTVKSNTTMRNVTLWRLADRQLDLFHGGQ